jgi:regulatory protein
MDAYLDAIKMLARRELSEAQVRQRLARRGHDEDAIEAAVERLKSERAIDDERVASAIAHSETRVKRRGKLRVRRQIESAGIARDTARRAADDVFEDLDEEALTGAALAKRLRADERVESDAQFQKLYRYLIGQGFDPDAIMKVLTARRRSHDD